MHTHKPGHHHAITSISVSLIYSPSCLGQETAKWPYGFRVTATYVNHTNAKSSLCPFHAERQAGKLWIPIFKVFWYGSTKKWTRVYRLQGGRSYHYTIALTTTPSLLNQALQNPPAAMHQYRQIKKWPSWAASTCFIRIKILLIKVTVTATATVSS